MQRKHKTKCATTSHFIRNTMTNNHDDWGHHCSHNSLCSSWHYFYEVLGKGFINILVHVDATALHNSCRFLMISNNSHTV